MTLNFHLKINPAKRSQTIKCETCGEKLYPSDIVGQHRDIQQYPFEGLLDTFICPHCGYLTIVPEDDRVWPAKMVMGDEIIVPREEAYPEC